MSIAEVKEKISKMNARQRREIQAHLLELAVTPRRGTLAWRREMARRIDEMKAGGGYTLGELKVMLGKKRT